MNGFYGRDRELAVLREEWQRACRGERRLVHLQGAPGVGKTALVEHLRAEIEATGGKLSRAGDRDPLGEAVTGLLRQVLAGPARQLEAWRVRLRAVCQPHASVLIGQVPLLKHFLEVGEESGGAPNEARLRVALTALWSVLGQPGEAVALLLDDLARADEAALSRLRFLLSGEEGRAQLIVAVHWPDPPPGRSLALGGLDPAALEAMIRERFPGPHEPGLVEQLALRSAGNPGTVRLLARLDREAVEQLERAPEAVDLLVARMEELLPEERARLARAALRDDPGLDGLEGARRLGLVEGQRFAHPRLREAALAGLTAESRSQLHEEAWRELARSEEPEHQVQAAEHLLQALDRLRDRTDRTQAARLALAAGRMRRRAADPGAAARFLAAGLQILGVDGWREHYELHLALSAELCAVRPEEDVLAAHLGHARTLTDAAPAWLARLRRDLAANRPELAWRTAQEFLQKCGRPLARPGPLALLASWLRVQWLLRGRTPEQLASLPVCRDPLLQAVHEVQTLSALAEARVSPQTVPWSILRDVRSLLEDGWTAGGAQGWTGYGAILCTRFGRADLGLRFGQLALDQLERLGAHESWPRVAWLVEMLLRPWSATMDDWPARLRSVSQRALQLGDTLVGFYAAAVGDFADYFRGAELAELERAVETTLRTLRRYAHEAGEPELEELRQGIVRLRQGGGGSAGGAPPSARDPFLPSVRLVFQLQQALLFRREREAFELVMDQQTNVDEPFLGPLPMLYWTYALVALARAVEQGWTTRARVARRWRTGQAILRRWVQARPDRRWRLRWVAAALPQAGADALLAYQEALDGARQNGSLGEAALLAEQAGQWADARGRWREARALREEALELYRQWGASDKVRQFERLHSEVAGSAEQDLQSVVQFSDWLAGELRLEELLPKMLDLALVSSGAQKGSLLLAPVPPGGGTSQEGGTRVPPGGGTSQEGGWTVAAEAELGQGAHLCRREVRLEEPLASLPATLLRLAERTREVQWTSDARQDAWLKADDYVRREQPRSLLCLPLARSQTLLGLLYLEDNRGPARFRPDRLPVLRALASQIALSIESSRHFQQILQEQLARQAALARQEALAAFLGIASHDLKSPLTAIQMWTRQLDGDPETLEEIRENLLTACQRAQSLISLYLDVAALEAGARLRLHLSDCDLGELVDRELEYLLGSLPPTERRQAALEWDAPARTARVDRERLGQVLANLVGNAFKHCPAGTPVRVVLSEEDGELQLSVADEGPGLPGELLATLFQPFGPRSSLVAGSGLGLWISRAIVEAHGGRLELDRGYAPGCRFVCHLPLSTCAAR